MLVEGDGWYIQMENELPRLMQKESLFKIPKEIIGNNTYNEDVDIFKGIAFRSNYFKDITDVSPAFEVEKII